ncbi:MAG: ABC transporter substrate-binding protein, partial [Treponema sp.]|nr:ABC transporter substrate-binding protein [Treponema sp.]
MKKTVFIFLLALVLVMGTYAAGGSQSGGAAPKAAAPLVINYLIDKDTPFDGQQAVIDAIQKKLNIRTDVEIRAGGTEGDNIMKTRLATGDMSDIFFYNTGSLLQAINPDRNIMDLSNEPFAAKLTDAFKRSASVNGKLYAIPGGSTMAGAILYNKAIYNQLGLSVPHTWNDFIANCQKIQAAGKTAVIASLKDTWT